MTKRVREILKERVKSAHSGKIWYLLTKDNVRHYWDTIRAEMGWKDNRNYCPYICRHTTASRMVSGGVSLIMVMKFMGHTQWSTTLGYAHLASSDLVFVLMFLKKIRQKLM